MNVSCMTDVLKKLAFPLVACGMLVAASTATAQDYGDIERIFKYPEDAYVTPLTAPGQKVNFRIRLRSPAGNFDRVYVGLGSETVDDLIRPLGIRIRTGREGLTYATLTAITAYSPQQTDLEFTYTVQPGDMALPMTIYGGEGSSDPGEAYQFINDHIWKIVNMGNSQTSIWRFVENPINPDPTFAKQNVRLQTLQFEAIDWEVQQTTTLQNCLVKTSTGQAVSNNVTFYVWSDDTNTAQIVEQAGQNYTVERSGQIDYAALTLLPGDSQRVFSIYGRNEGFARIYLSPAPPPTKPGETNYITKTVEVTAPPPPTVNVSLDPLATELDGFVHLEESDVKDKPLHVTFTQAYSGGPVTIRLDVSPSGVVALETNRVTLAAGETESRLVRFAPSDGDLNGVGEVIITPVIETPGAVAYFGGRLEPAKIKITNKVPAVQLSNPDPNPPVSTTVTVFPWALTDVAADVSAGVIFKWSFGDGSTLVETNYTTVGTVTHIYNNSAAANRILRLEVKDKDMSTFAQAAEMSFTVDLPVATPKLEIITQSSATETGGLVRVQFALSQSYAQDVTVALTVEPPEWTNNIAFQDMMPGMLPGPVTIPATKLTNEADFDMWYKVLDGNTNLASLVFRPVVVSTPGDASYYTPVERNIFIRNTPPQITAINGNNVNAISNVTVAATMPKTFTVDVKDVTADLGSIRTYWVFSDDPTNVYEMVGTAMPLLGVARASIDHTFAAPGMYTVRVWAEDKDQAPGASADDYREFYVSVGAPPTVRVRPPAGAISEDPLVTDNDFVVVELNVAPPFGSVAVSLSVSPPNSSQNGSLVFDDPTVVFTRQELDLGILEKPVSINSLLKDGTRISNSTGFTVTPTVTGSIGVPEFYGANLVSGIVRIHNENPKIINPKNRDTAATAEVAFSVAQGTPYVFYWEVDDAMEDWNSEPGSTNTWYFGDNSTFTASTRYGSYAKTYNTLGIKTVRFVSRDKDGGSHEVSFNIRVDPAKRLDVTPVGHISGSASGDYAGMAGLGRGIVISSNAVPVTGSFVGGKYQFSYDPAEVAAELLAIPMKVDSTFDSFMYQWIGEGIPELDKAIVSPARTSVTLQQTVIGADGQTQAQPPATVHAIFSRELLVTDNCGDINGDGIPDIIAASTTWRSGQTLNTIMGTDRVPANTYNADNDFLPDRDNYADWIIPDLGTYAPVGRAFDAYREIRGYHEGLNRLDFGSDEDYGPGEEEVHNEYGPNPDPYTRAAERPTDPTVADTDDDGYPDGWEYYFWYNTLVRKLTGSEYDPNDVATGKTIGWKELYLKFDPLRPDHDKNRDTDKDGLTDFEEMLIGTNPIHWDTDGDGMCDGWEVLRGLDPLNLNDRNDAQDPRYNNPDGDYMAISVVKRDLVTGVDGKTYLQNPQDGSLWSWYRYGPTNNAATPIAVGTNVTGIAVDTAIPAVINQNALILHFQVYHEFGFDPRTAWCASVERMPDYAQNYPVPDGWFELSGAFRSRFSVNPWVESDAANTRPFTAYDEYLLMKFMAENGLAAATTPATAAGWSRSTHPKTPDSDATDTLVDGVPDGWELYVMCEPGTRTIGISPWSASDGIADNENPADPNRGDGLSVRREFSGTDSAAAYASPALYTAQSVTVRYSDGAISYQTADLPKSTVTLTDPTWINKFWPTDPWSKDTDGDGVRDGEEAAFIYGGTDNGTTCIVGGGLNPCSVDTDLDALPDGFELQFTHSAPGAADGMDGTVKDAYGEGTDWDKDGLENYQEYWVQAVRSFRYDITTNDLTAAESLTGSAVTGLPMDQTYDPSSLFTQVTNTWDVARYPFGDTEPPLWVLLPVGTCRLYVSTDPRDADTDNDSLDDYYEMFHGLNPILGVRYAGDDEYVTDRVASAYRLRSGGVTITALLNDWNPNPPQPLEMNFVSYPWLTGLQTADPDADGLLTFEEMLQPNQPSPSYHNTDPTPLWLTDSSSWESVTARFYNPRLNMDASAEGGRWKGMFYWPPSPDRPAYVFSFEENEGYDTDNDGLSDKDELTQGMGGYGDPQDHDDPIRRQALWFDGTQSAAWTPASFNYGAFAFRSFTVELWVRPETVTSSDGQVLIERPVVYTGQSDLSVPDTLMRRTFQLGIAADGRAYAMFENAGFHDEHTGTAEVFGPVLRANDWVHLAARMDGQALTIFVNGKLANSQPTSLIPATGVLNVSSDPNSDVGYIFTAAPLVLGAANDSVLLPPVWSDFSRFFHGSIDEVRVWDGARPDAAIAADFRTRYTKSQEAASLGSADGSRLIHHYSFDNLFGAATASDVLQAPRGFEALAVTTNRPAGYQVGWWSALPVASLVYTNYAYVPWIENGIDHLPLPGGRVQNSVYWAEGSTGGASAQNVFPNSNNPYGWGFGFVGAADLVPLGYAFARTINNLWDEQGGSSRWSDTNDDSDHDGLPDAWELAVYGDLSKGWNSLYPDGSGLTAGEKYFFELAQGDPLDPDSYAWTSDSDSDGLPDWWEQMYGLNSGAPTGENGPDGDPDEDGLTNLYEYLARTNPFKADTNDDGVWDGHEDSDGDGVINLEEMRLGADPGSRDTDDDGIEDGDEAAAGTHLAFSESPKKSMSLLLTAAEEIEIPQPLKDRERFTNQAFTLEMWVNPSAPGQTASLIRYEASAVTAPTPIICYQLGLNAGVPYVLVAMSTDPAASIVVQGGELPVNEWTHVSGVFDPEMNALTLYLNGYALASKYVAGDALAGSPYLGNYKGVAKIGGGFEGHLDDVRVWKVALTQDQVIHGIEHLVAAGDTRLVCYFRFDDGGLTAEDSAHPIRPSSVTVSSASVRWPSSLLEAREYCLKGVTFDDTVAYDGLRLEADDFDGDGLPDWCESFQGRISVSYPVTRVVTVAEVSGDNTVWVDKYLTVDHEETEIISPTMEPSSSLLDLGWGVQYGPVTSVPRYTRPDGTAGGYLDDLNDAAWLLKDVYIASAEELETLEARFTSHSITSDDILCFNGKMIPLSTLQPSSVTADIAANTETYRLELWENRYNFQLEPDFLLNGGYFKIGWNRIAVKLVNQDGNAGSRRYEYFDLTLITLGQKTVIDYGERWYRFGYTGSMVEPPKDGQGRTWSDPEYGKDAGADPDGDGLPNYYEAMVGTNPNAPDTDGDGVLDSHEDYDGDGLQNLLEFLKGTDPRLPDTDDDGRPDAEDGYIGASHPWATNSVQPYVERHLHLDGDGYVQAPLSSRWSSGDGSFTLRLSVRPQSLPTGTPAVLAAREVSAGVYNYAILLRTDGRVQARVTTDTGSGTPTHLDIISPSAIPVGQWSSIAMVADLNQQRLLLLVNGQNAGSAFGNLSKLPASSGKGVTRAYFGAGLNGDLDNIAFYREALSEYQLQQIREEGILKVPTPSLYGCYLFDDGTNPGGVSGVSIWRTGQVQDFACIFWSEDDQRLAGFSLRDWETGWRNAGTLYGAQTAVADTNPPDPTTDSDGDGMPDAWEITYGFDPYDSTGENGALGDPDGDGLSNYAEYLASTRSGDGFPVAVNPRLFSTDQKVPDYFRRVGSLYLGEMFADHDFMENAWEEQFAPNKVSSAIYDAHMDNDEDGWSNWAEARYSAAKEPVRPDQRESVTTNGQSRYEFPIPVVEALIHYNGIRSEAGLVIVAYRDPAMDGQPVATFRVAAETAGTGWPKRLVLDRATNGYLREGANYFFAFLDISNNGSWDPGEPCGLPQPAVTQIGWDRNRIAIELTDYMQGYLRVAIPSGVLTEDVFNGTGSQSGGGSQQGGGLEQRVRVYRTGVDGQNRHRGLVFDKVLRTPRTWLHEGDLWAQGVLALDWGLTGVDTQLDRVRLSYEVYLGNEPAPTNGAVAFFTNMFDVARAKAVSVAPINGAYVYSARPTFKWKLPAGSETKYPAFAFEMRLGSEQGTVMYQSDPMSVPPRNANGEFVWEAPFYANSRLPNGQVFQSNRVYAWRVIAMNAKFSNTTSNWSDWKYFRLDVNAPMQSSGYGSVDARVKYYGPATAMLTGRVKVQAYRTASFTGLPEAEYTLAGSDISALTSLAAPVVNARLYGLQESGVAGPYYLCAYIDHNGNGVRDPWESWGYANDYGVNAALPYTARPVEVLYSAAAPRVDIVIEDADTDQDWVPDAWEYEQNPGDDFLDLVGPATGTNGDTEINPNLTGLLERTPAFFAMLALGTTDLDGDGLGDLHELVLGSNPRAASTAGDGYSDRDKTNLGLNPADVLRFNVTDISFADGLPEVAWSVEVEKAGVQTMSLAPEVTYELLYTPSLVNPQWQVVRSGTVDLDGVRVLTSQVEAAAAASVDPNQGFFRLRLTTK